MDVAGLIGRLGCAGIRFTGFTPHRNGSGLLACPGPLRCAVNGRCTAAVGKKAAARWTSFIASNGAPEMSPPFSVSSAPSGPLFSIRDGRRDHRQALDWSHEEGGLTTRSSSWR
jgi:hypothetical protein